MVAFHPDFHLQILICNLSFHFTYSRFERTEKFKTKSATYQYFICFNFFLHNKSSSIIQDHNYLLFYAFCLYIFYRFRSRVHFVLIFLYDAINGEDAHIRE
jgi:hypothetical protein